MAHSILRHNLQLFSPTDCSQLAVCTFVLASALTLILSPDLTANAAPGQIKDPMIVSRDTPEAIYVEKLVRQDRKKALAYLKQKLIYKPNDSFLLLATACLQTDMDEVENSIVNLKKYFVVNPQSREGQAYMHLATDYLLLGQNDKAIGVYNQAINMIPDAAFLYCERGCVYSTVGQLDKGITDLNKALTLDPNNTHYFEKRGDIWAQKKNYQKAADDYSAAIRLKTSVLITHAKRADMYKKLGRNDLAQKDLLQADKFGLEMLQDK